MAKTDQRQAGDGRKHKIVRSLSKKAIAPIVASLTAYAVKKVPGLLEDKILPKVRERTQGGSSASKAQTTRSVSATNGTDGASSSTSPALSPDEREEARRQREEHRRARREAAT